LGNTKVIKARTQKGSSLYLFNLPHNQKKKKSKETFFIHLLIGGDRKKNFFELMQKTFFLKGRFLRNREKKIKINLFDNFLYEEV